MKIVHLSTLHTRVDARIFEKQATSLTSNFPGEVTYIVADGNGGENCQGVEILDVGPLKGGRLNRFLSGSWRAFRKVREVKPAILHFHDPELILVGFALKLFGVKIIYDVHEDLPRHLMFKPWIFPLLKRPLSFAIELLEQIAARSFDSVVSVTPHIAKRFPEHKTVTVANFADGSSISADGRKKGRNSRPVFIYSGNITRERGAIDMLSALEMLRDINPKLILAGKFNELDTEERLRGMPAWDMVEFTGWLPREDLDSLLLKSDVGLSVPKSNPAYDHAYPTKVFEYMKFGLPVIGSNLPAIIDILKDGDCGIIVPSQDPQKLAEAMRELALNKEKREHMSTAAQIAFDEKYNWATQESKLIELYNRLIDQ